MQGGGVLGAVFVGASAWLLGLAHPARISDRGLLVEGRAPIGWSELTAHPVFGGLCVAWQRDPADGRRVSVLDAVYRLLFGCGALFACSDVPEGVRHTPDLASKLGMAFGAIVMLLGGVVLFLGGPSMGALAPLVSGGALLVYFATRKSEG